MDKKELISVLSHKLETTKKEAGEILDAVFMAVMQSVKKHKLVRITNVMTIQAKEVPGRPGINPRTQEPIEIPDKTRLYCRFGRAFKALVDGPKAPAQPKKKGKK